jgi:hypothetical protein
MNFSEEEMLDYIEKIGDKIEGTDTDTSIPLNQDEMDEVFAFVRWYMESGQNKAPINFRFIQQCFDYRRTSSIWKELISEM